MHARYKQRTEPRFAQWVGARIYFADVRDEAKRIGDATGGVLPLAIADLVTFGTDYVTERELAAIDDSYDRLHPDMGRLIGYARAFVSARWWER